VNGPTERYCSRCGTVLSEEERVKLEERGEQLMRMMPLVAKAYPKYFDEIPDVMDLIKLFRESPVLMKEFLEEMKRRKEEKDAM
jgi:hypothetical protein